jgi:hypothetical protein
MGEDGFMLVKEGLWIDGGARQGSLRLAEQEINFYP